MEDLVKSEQKLSRNNCSLLDGISDPKKSEPETEFSKPAILVTILQEHLQKAGNIIKLFDINEENLRNLKKLSKYFLSSL